MWPHILYIILWNTFDVLKTCSFLKSSQGSKVSFSLYCYGLKLDGVQQSPHGQSIDGEQRWRNALYSGNSRGPCSEVETRGGRANGSVMASGCPTASDNQQDDDIVDIWLLHVLLYLFSLG